MNAIHKSRIRKELQMLADSPPSGISCVSADDRLDLLSAQIIGASGTPYEGGTFHLEIQIPERYPFDPPRIRFVTPIYHPNIDTSGRICLDTLKLPPKGTWRPCLNIGTVLMMIRVLMAEPGSEDPLMTDIWQEFRYDYATYTHKAKEWTKKHAMPSNINKENLSVSSSLSKEDDRKQVVNNLPTKRAGHGNTESCDTDNPENHVTTQEKTASSGQDKQSLSDISNKKPKLL